MNNGYQFDGGNRYLGRKYPREHIMDEIEKIRNIEKAEERDFFLKELNEFLKLFLIKGLTMMTLFS